MSAGTIAGKFGKGLLAGLAGTVAITVAQMVEAKLMKQPPDTQTMTADAAGKVLGVAPTGEAEKTRFATLVHFGYGTAWGGIRGLLGALGLRGTAADMTHFAAVSTAASVMLPGLKVAPPLKEQGVGPIALNSLNHLIYALAAGAVFSRLDGGDR